MTARRSIRGDVCQNGTLIGSGRLPGVTGGNGSANHASALRDPDRSLRSLFVRPDQLTLRLSVGFDKPGQQRDDSFVHIILGRQTAASAPLRRGRDHVPSAGGRDAKEAAVQAPFRDRVRWQDPGFRARTWTVVID